MPSTRKSCMDESNNSDEETCQDSCTKSRVDITTSQWIFLINEEAIAHDPNVDYQRVVTKLKHPHTEKAALFLFTHEDRTIYEVTKFKEECRSWFIDDTVQSDGSIYLTTQIDPLFLVLPYFMKSAESGKYMTLEQIVTDEDYPECHRLTAACENFDLENIADVKGNADLRAYKYDEDKTLSWLKVKTERVSKALNEKNVYVSGAKSEELIASKATEEEYMRYAFGVVSDYLPKELANRLREHLGISVAVEKRQTDSKNPPSKRVKLEDITPAEDYSQNMKLEPKSNKGKQSTAQRKLEKVDKTGMKSMMSFFSPKT